MAIVRFTSWSPLRVAAGLTALALCPAQARALPPTLRLRALLPEAVGSPSAAAPPFYLAADLGSRERARTCLASAVYYESANQPLQGQQAVAQVVLNRVRHVAYPKSICGVVYDGAPRPGCQFTFACDGSLGRAPDAKGWKSALSVADQALNGYVEISVGVSTHYHTTRVHPLWDAAMTPTRRIGAHQFYRFPSVLTDALGGAYAGAEPQVYGASLLTNVKLSSTAWRGVRPEAQATLFTVWGLQIALVKPGDRSVTVIPSLLKTQEVERTGQGGRDPPAS